MEEYRLLPVIGEIRSQVLNLLEENDLPVADLDQSKNLFALVQNNEVIGTGGLEFFKDCALVRSVSVRKGLRGLGWGKAINKELEIISRQNGIRCLFLLTTTAEGFFDKEGYVVTKREEVPLSIKSSSEFSSLCPSSAIVMKKIL